MFIDSGTTTYQMTPFLLDKEKINSRDKLITCSFRSNRL
ncbi:hypothetical protein OL548_11255 [Lysinibacillus sp. MHQ-1]|nr:hypothetical protein OL548_11255 [Lysinibacillus sp. MHQ-1]